MVVYTSEVMIDFLQEFIFTNSTMLCSGAKVISVVARHYYY